MKPTVLFVDDDPEVPEAIGRLLRREGWKVLSAGDASSALEVLARERVDVIVSDECMPGLPGSALVTHVRRGWPDVVRILLTGHPSPPAIERAMGAGDVFRFLTKPCSAVDLFFTIQGALRAKAEREAAEEVHVLNDVD